jgi:hypothetical protein
MYWPVRARGRSAALTRTQRTRGPRLLGSARTPPASTKAEPSSGSSSGGSSGGSSGSSSGSSSSSSSSGGGGGGGGGGDGDGPPLAVATAAQSRLCSAVRPVPGRRLAYAPQWAAALVEGRAAPRATSGRICWPPRRAADAAAAAAALRAARAPATRAGRRASRSPPPTWRRQERTCPHTCT